MRPLTTLKANPQFKLPKQDIRNGFMALYNGTVGMNAYEFMFKLTANLVWGWTCGEDPSLSMVGLKQYLKDHVKDPNRKYVVKSVLRRNPLTKSLEFKTPIFRNMAAGESYLANTGLWSNDYKIPSAASDIQKQEVKRSVQTIDDTVFAGGKVLTATQVLERTKFSGRQADIIKHCLSSVEGVLEDGHFIVYATWKMNQKEAEYLNNVPFMQINLGSLFPTLLEWSANVIGRDVNLPDTVSQISTIAAEVEGVKSVATVPPRVGIDGMVVDVNRHYYVIPEINNTAQYEERILDFGTQEDGSYTWRQNYVAGGEQTINVGEGVQRKKLPVNMPVYTDWLNDKFVYSNSAGNLSVYDLSTTVPLKFSHINTLLNMEMDTDSKEGQWGVLCTAIDLAAQFDRSVYAIRPDESEINPQGAEELTKINRETFTAFRTMVDAAYQLHIKSVGTLEDFFIGPSKRPLARLHQLAKLQSFQWLFRAAKKALTALQNNIEVMYTRYSVMNVLQQLSVLTLIVNYAPRQVEVDQKDKEERDNYINQGVDKDAPIEGVPNIKNGLQYLPHQAKVQNILRRGPKFAIIPVDAGGGKTIVILTNILLELKKGHCKRPVIMCPAHLVAQYVKEVVFVTEGRINLIPITNSAFKAHGEEKIKKFIENSPPNTIVVTDFNFLKGRKQRVAYGNKTLEIFRNAEFMRQFEFDLVAIDESHYLKNLKSSRREASARFMQDIPMKRIASGTLISDTLLDLVSQIALIDPTIFGSEELFKRQYAKDMRGAKVMAYKDGTEQLVRKILAEHCVVAGARRKEWAALLPPKKERFIGVEMSKNQRLLYDSILADTMELIQEAMARDAEVRELMESEDDSKAEELEAKLRPYMARLERYMSSPESDPAAQIFLKDEEDLTSPKVKKIYEICREHLNGNLPGKILIFTQYTASAEAVAKNAPSDLKPYFIHYTADMKAECKTEFENDANKKIMVGVSSSMDTGLNLQFASRLIRMETVWTPGVLEQGNSRINRPELKKAEERNMVYFDWIVINKSIDITKVARLVSKLISKAKFDEYDNPAYAAIPNVPQVAMTMESIAANNDFQVELLPYLEAYEQYQMIEEADYAEYKRQQGDKITPIDVPQEGLLSGSKLMSRIPYVPEMELYGVDKLGLVRYDHFVRQDMSALEDDESDVETDDEDTVDEAEDAVQDPKALKRAAIRAQVLKERALVMNRAVHTDFGDGTIVYVGPKRVIVRLADGTKVRIFKLQTYIITRSTTNSLDMRNELLKQVGKIPLDAPISVPVEEGVQDKKRKLKAGGEKVAPEPQALGPSAEFDFTVMNDFLALMYRGDGTDKSVVSILQNFGFKITPDYNYVKIFGPRSMLKFMKGLAAAGFTLSKANSEELKRIYLALKVNKKAMNTIGFATKMEVTTFYRDQLKPSSDQKLLKIYPLVQDGLLYLIFPTKGQPANVKAKRVQIPESAWKQSQDMEMLRLFANKAEAKAAVQQMRDAGLNISQENLDELGEQFKSIKVVAR